MFGKHKFLKIASLVAVLLALGVITFFILLRPGPLFSTLPATTTASFGHTGDPINIAVVGDKGTIVSAFLAAHWLVPDPITASSTVRIAETSIANSAYPTAPVSSLYLFGRAQDLAFELPTDSVRQRHHVRLWQTTITISGKPLWVGSATYDSDIELSGTTALPTHHISPNVDSERDFVAQSFMDAGLMQSETSNRISYPTLWGFNGGGDWYFDDGLVRMLVLR
ncbi:MAG TPA: LssY C-terminal domain-containing protein [Candidatus Paceibacterota bacterium]|nr:LssY C-terminal domain-containing protein [Candidatus Paceibacterota bacterium]